jgi:pilus assembly protein CpaE
MAESARSGERSMTMITTYIAAAPDLAERLVPIVRGLNDCALLGVAHNIREALAECGTAAPGALVLDDRLLDENLGLLPAVQGVAYPVLLVCRQASAEAARRALAIGARDLVTVEDAAIQLPGLLARHAQAAGETAAPGRVLAIFSSKGGVGKTTLAVNLAVALGKLGRRPAALLDLDLHFGDAAALVGDRPRATLHDLVGLATLEPPTVERVLTPVADGAMRFLAAPARPQEAEDVRAELVVKVLEGLRLLHPFVVVDTVPGFSDVNVAALDFADVILTMVAPEVVSIRSLRQTLELFTSGFRYPPSKVRLILNRSGSETGVDARDVTAVLGHPVAWELPSDGAWPVRAANRGEPLVLYQPQGRLSQRIREMAKTFVEEAEGPRRIVKERAQARGGWWRRWSFRRHA